MAELDPAGLAAVDHVLSTTRAVRRRLDLDRPVPREVVLECLRLAVQAPTGGNAQGWRWLVVTDAGQASRAGRALHSQRAGDYLAAAAAGATDPQMRRVYESALALTETLHRVPVHVIPCIGGRVEGAANVMAASVYGSILPAAWSFQLALRSRGLGSVLTTLHLAREAEAAALLGIPSDVTQVALLPVAYTRGTDFKPAERPPVEQITVLGHVGGDVMQEHTTELIVEAEVPEVWRLLHPRRPTGKELPWRIEYPGGSLEVLVDGDEAGQGLVRMCTFRVPRYLLSGGMARSFESIVEARINELSRYSAVGKPLWSRAEGWHRLEEVGEGRTKLTFWESVPSLQPRAPYALRAAGAPLHLRQQRQHLRQDARPARPGRTHPLNEGTMSTTIMHESDADVSALAGKQVAVVGYGNQGRPWALNLRDSGLDVRVCVRADETRERATADGFVAADIEAASTADVLCLLVPDDIIPTLSLAASI